MNRRKLSVQILFTLSILFLIACFYWGKNYDSYLFWLSDKTNVIASCFVTIGLMSITIVILYVLTEKERSLRHYYSKESDKYRNENYELRSDKIRQSEIIQDLKMEIKTLKSKLPIKKTK